MADLVFLKALRDKLKGGNTKSIHLNVLPGRFATRLDFANLNYIKPGYAESFLESLLTKTCFDYKISFDAIDLNTVSTEDQKKFGLLSKRLNSLNIENEDNYKEHGIKTFGFGYPILIKPSKQDPKKIIKAPLFIWQLEMVKATNKINTWSILRNKIKTETGKIIDDEIHSVGLNEVLLSYLKNDEGVVIPQINEDLLEDALIDKSELLDECHKILVALNSNLSPELKADLLRKFTEVLTNIPESATIDARSNNLPYIHFGGVFGLFRTQKESIITDIDKLIERANEFKFDDLKVEGFSGTAHSAVETDPSQQEILSTLGLDPKKIIQGPPGTGKSQSLTALITNALANNLKCLVVCEKKTAHDVIKNNLHRENGGLGALAAVIEDIGKDRDAIVNSVRDRIGNPIMSYYSNQINYNTVKHNIEHAVEEVNKGHAKLGEGIYQGKTWTELVGEFLKREDKVDHTALTKIIDYKLFRFTKDENELDQFISKIKEAKKLYAGVGTLMHPLDILTSEVFDQDNSRGVKLRVENFTESVLKQLEEVKSNLVADLDQYQKWLDGHYEELENKAKQNLEILQSESDKYSEWLTNHYLEYYNCVLLTIKEFDTYVTDNFERHGESFFKNDGFTIFKVNVLSVFSKRHKELKIQKQLIFQKISNVKQKHEIYNYVNHNYHNASDIDSNRILVENINKLKNSLHKWYSNIDSTKSKLLFKFSYNGIHPVYPELKSIEKTESQFKELYGDLSLEKYFNMQKSGFETHQTKISLLNLFLKEFSNINSIKEKQHKALSSELKHPKFISELLTENESLFTSLKSKIEEEKIILEIKGRFENHAKKVPELERLTSIMDLISKSTNDFGEYYNWKKFVIELSALEKAVIEAIISIDCEDWVMTFEAWYYYWLLAENEHRDLLKDDSRIEDLFELKKEFKKLQIQNVVQNWSSKQIQATKRLQQSTGINAISLFNKRGAAGQRRNSLRKIVNTDFSLFTDFFPVVMVSPTVCSSIIPLYEGIFDVVIFDEASQLRIEDTYPALLRGQIKIISGDSQQMPPANYFTGGNALLNPTEDDYEEDITPQDTQDNIRKIDRSFELADSESLLVYAENCNYKQSYLKIHYRSQHPSLIDFSNHAFYGKRLIPMPAKKEYVPIDFIEVNGIYEDSVNLDEAKRVVDILLHKIKKNSDGRYPTVGVATFNLYQRNLILEEISIARQSKPEYDKKIGDLGSDLFVKNLENIQGDERDIIILSTTFGRKNDGNFRQNFGPIVQGKGYKLLNVIVTRAKQKVFVCCSIPQDSINQYSLLLQQFKNTGRGVFYAYLAYAKAVSEANVEVRDSILLQLYENCEMKTFDVDDTLGSESPFEEEVFYRLAHRIGQDRIQQQYKIGGFRIDMVIKSKVTGLPVIALECDGAKYHSSNEAYAWDMFRQSQLENHGLVFYRIWSTNWWNNVDKEVEKIVHYINQFDTEEGKIPEDLFS